jgi:hypothetical protein
VHKKNGRTWKFRAWGILTFVANLYPSSLVRKFPVRDVHRELQKSRGTPFFHPQSHHPRVGVRYSPPKKTRIEKSNPGMSLFYPPILMDAASVREA